MRTTLKSAMTGIGIAATLAVGGCAYHDRGPGPEPVTVGYPESGTYDTYYADPYYNQGYYVDNDWRWRDRDGHEHREARAEHERRMSSGRERVQAGGRQEERMGTEEYRGRGEIRNEGGANREQRGAGQYNSAQRVAPRGENTDGYRGGSGASSHAYEGHAGGAEAGHGGAEVGHAGGGEAGRGGDGHR